MNYKGYEASTHYSEQDQIFWGEIINISSPTSITFEAENAKDLQSEFQQSVDFYLSVCCKKNKEPKKPMSGKFVVRINPLDHAKLVARASSDNISLNKWVAQAIRSRLELM